MIRPVGVPTFLYGRWYVSISGGRRSTDRCRHHATGHCPCSRRNDLGRKMRMSVYLLLSCVLTNDTALLNVVPVFSRITVITTIRVILSGWSREWSRANTFCK